ncbi:MAG: Inner rane component of cytoplasmic domain [Pseudomonadota bacterium]|jgi:hypothetical protein
MNTKSNAITRDTEAGRRDNRLLGWLVSYGLDQRGAAFEIRAGRTIITAGPAQGTHTISVQDETISSPHAAINAVSRDHVVLLQDIFSEFGTFITRSGERDESPVEGPVVLRHGDWVHIGETVRFQVCLIDGGH